MSTPEGVTKGLIKALLADYHIFPASKAGDFPPSAEGWYYMPSQNRLGVKGIPDFLGHFKGMYWALEAKAPGKKPTGFQALQIKAISQSGGAVFVVDGKESLEVFQNWLHKIIDEEA